MYISPSEVEELFRRHIRECPHYVFFFLRVSFQFGTINRPEEKELEISNFSVHTDFYAKRFGWKEKSERTIWSGCSGIGPFRWAYVFLARWGFNFDEWPEQIKEIIKKLYGKMPEVPKLVSWP